MKLSVIAILILFSFHGQSQDSLNMERIGQWDPPIMPTHAGVQYNDIWGYTADDGSEYAILGNVDSIMVVDVTNPAQPTRVFGHYGGGHAIWRDFKVYQDYAYAVCDGCSEGLHIFDMSPLPASPPVHVATIDTFFTRAHNIFIDTTTAKLYACGSNTANKGLNIIDISTPDVPVRISDYLFQGSGNFYVHDLYVKNDTAYCSHGNQGYYIWDMTDLSSVELLGSYDSPGYNHSSWNDSSGQYAYYAEEVPLGRPMAVMDLANMGHPTDDIELLKTFKDPISTTATNVTPHNPFVKNDTLYISYYEDGIKVYDLNDPTDPELIGYYDTYSDNGSSYTGYEGAWGTYPFFASGNIMISDITYGLNIVKVQDCPSPTSYYRDKDGDGYGNVSEMVSSCSFPGGYVLDSTDCDDDDNTIYPGAPEICDGKDNDCDGFFDQDDGDVVLSTFYRDFDNDGYGDVNVTILDCSPPDGYVDDDSDCDDNNNMVNPAFPEICDNIDNDCDGLIDADDPDLTNIEWYLDNDGDGVGEGSVLLFQCAQPAGYVAFQGDCDDNDDNNFPGNVEVCDGQDNNCNGQIDENCPVFPCDGVNIYVNPIIEDVYRAKVQLSSDASSTPGQDFEFFAEQEILLEEGFEVVNGSSFFAAIEDCEDVGNITVSESEKLDAFIMELKEYEGEDSGIHYYVKSNGHALTREFIRADNMMIYIDKLKAENQDFKLYIFRDGDLIKQMDK